ncbi:cysteine sulfinic acid decarboxylase-like [Panulirus ornatus]|uniref:cysteine sulfinic acid decarboxylase-like n=1 Tax=Panulirus ornatus TaxID=150431 RepID=UPI003A8A2A55
MTTPSRATTSDPTRATGTPSNNYGNQLLEKVLAIVRREKLVTGVDEGKKLVEFQHPKDLEKLLQLDIGREALSYQEAVDLLERVVRHSIRTQHPHFFNNQFHGIDEVSLTAAWLLEALNTNQHTFEVAPVFILVEQFIIARLVSLFGWQEGDGLFSPGGTMSNTYGMMLARHRRFPHLKKTGASGMKPLVLFTSDQSHYSFKKAAALMGIGMDNVVIVKTDFRGRMLTQALREAVAEARAKGGDPFFVNATAGTTVLGSFDPLEEVADVCQEEGLWLHVDACWGGTAILSKTYKHLLQGVHRADSIAWNPHKMLGVTFQCSAFIVRHKGLLHECNSFCATYLFQTDKFYDVSYDIGDKAFQCGRKGDSLKLFLQLSLHGLDETERRIDGAFSASRYLSEQVEARPGFRPVLGMSQFTNVCFWYIPPSLRDQEETQDWWRKLGKVAPQLKARMMEAGTMMIAYQPLHEKNLVNFLRMINSCYPTPTKADMDFALDEIERLGADL